MIFIYMNLKKIIKEEINDLQWVKDVDFFVPFESAKYGTIYKAKIINQRLSDDISENCGLSYFDIDKDYFVWVERELKNVESQDMFCDNQHYEGTEPALHLFFYSSKTGNYIDDLWVTEDVVKLYPTDVKPNYKEGNIVLKESDGLEWIKDVVTAKLAKNENWILVNDVDRESISEGHEIQKYLFDLGYSWGTGDLKNHLKDFCIYTIYHFGNVKDDDHLYYQDGCRSAEVRISDRDIKSGEHMVYYWSDLKPKTIKESDDFDDFEWAKGEIEYPLYSIDFLIGKKAYYRKNNLDEVLETQGNPRYADLNKSDLNLGKISGKGWTINKINPKSPKTVTITLDGGGGQTWDIDNVLELVRLGVWVIEGDDGKFLNESNELDWLKNIKPTLADAFKQESLKVGDVLRVSGRLADCDATKWKMVNDFKIKIVKLKKTINSSYFIPLQKKYWKHLGYDGIKAIRFYGVDGDMKIEDHVRKH